MIDLNKEFPYSYDETRSINLEYYTLDLFVLFFIFNRPTYLEVQ